MRNMKCFIDFLGLTIFYCKFGETRDVKLSALSRTKSKSIGIYLKLPFKS